MKITILIATHKQFEMPQDEIYLPVHVGKQLHPELDFGYQGDNTGDNISVKNQNYCELTAMYWAWKNCNSDYVGLAHYRRHFCYKEKEDKMASVLNTAEAESLCRKYDIILPRERKYYIETMWSHYKHTHDISHLEKTRSIIEKDYPEYVKSFDKVMHRTGAHLFNMFIMKKELADQYCAWLFNILFKLEKQIDLKGLSAFDARLFGRVSELLLDVWIDKHHYSYKEIGFVQMGDENTMEKVKYFLLAKFFGKKYHQSR